MVAQVGWHVEFMKRRLENALEEDMEGIEYRKGDSIQCEVLKDSTHSPQPL